ncbi:helix-turn-helix domain-containing protein [Nocardioides sp. NPDC047086]|uniref:helix-turn-helix domain-containing protein n=1 Tax=Nocardioides sp. NPDC047086 TaxID=3154810 RepID=UPI0033EEE880
MTQEDPERPPGQAAQEAAGKAIAAVIGGAVGGVPGALVAIALEPGFIELAARSWNELADLRRRSAGLMIQSASHQLGGDPEAVTKAAFASEARAQMFADALQAAASTANQAKIQALGKALANGLSGDEARVDEERLIIAGLSGLEEPHIRLLANLPRERGRPTSTPSGSARNAGARRGARLGEVADRSGLSNDAAFNVMAELVRTGMARQDGYGSERRHDRLILDLQEEVAKLQWIVQNLGKSPSGNRKPSKLSKPGNLVEPGFGRTLFGDRCLEYLEVSAPDIEYPEEGDVEHLGES